MQIAQHTVVSLKYTLTNPLGEVLDQADVMSPFVYLHGTRSIIPGLETALVGKQASDSLSVTIAPDDAYGARDERLTQQLPREMFASIPPEQLIPGAQFHAQTNGGFETITIAAVEGDTVTIDANHPLAGVTLHFEVEVLDVRTATAEEIAHGHVHGAHGHDHGHEHGGGCGSGGNGGGNGGCGTGGCGSCH
jgi:FKBP-type peptidyl-prolyl cis-trans isomerase SlyD